MIYIQKHRVGQTPRARDRDRHTGRQKKTRKKRIIGRKKERNRQYDGPNQTEVKD